MKYYELDKEEKKLLKELDKGEWVPLKDQTKARREAMEVARNTLNKTRNVNLRLTERDLQKLKAKAIKEGLPYQTFASSVLHKAVNP